MYIVMEKLTGGELFERIVGKPRFSEVHNTLLTHLANVTFVIT
jgi:hypothetical protein